MNMALPLLSGSTPDENLAAGLDKRRVHAYNRGTKRKEVLFMGKKDWKNTLSGVFDVIGEVLAVVYVVVFALLLIDAQWPFLGNVDWLYAVFKGIWTYGAFVIAAVVGLEAMVKRNFLLFLIFAALLVVCVIFIFFPGTYENLLNFIPSK